MKAAATGPKAGHNLHQQSTCPVRQASGDSAQAEFCQPVERRSERSRFDTEVMRLVARVIFAVGEAHRALLEKPPTLKAMRALGDALLAAGTDVIAWCDEREGKFRRVWQQ